jgi:hypothetical protein
MKGPGLRLFELGRGFERDGMERTFELQKSVRGPAARRRIIPHLL